MVTAQPPGNTSGAREFNPKSSIRTVTGSSPAPMDWKAHSSVATQPLPVAATSPIFTYAELQQRVHHDLRAQHPEWVEPTGDSPICDLYERRLAALIAIFQSTEANLSAV
jgi:hypothetical protein